MALLLFQFTVKRNLGGILCWFTHFGLVFLALPQRFGIWLSCWFYFVEFSYQTQFGLVFQLNYLFWAWF